MWLHGRWIATKQMWVFELRLISILINVRGEPMGTSMIDIVCERKIYTTFIRIPTGHDMSIITADHISKLYIHKQHWSAPSHYLNQCWDIGYWTLGNNRQWNFNRNHFHSRKYIWNFRLQNGVYFVSAPMRNAFEIHSESGYNGFQMGFV